MKKIIVGTDFSGIGSPEQALKNLEIPHEVEFACDIDKFARESYLANHDCKTMFEDITTRDHSKVKKLDLYVAGFPCQAFSLAGKRKGFDDIRGTLFFNVAEFIKTNQPETFILENVKGLVNHDKGRTFQTIIDLLSNCGGTVNGQMALDFFEDGLGYHVYFQVLNTKEHGIPQNRERIFIVGFKEFREYRFPQPEPLKLKLKDLLESEVDEKYYLSDNVIHNLIDYNKRQVKNGTGFSAKFRDVRKVEIMDTIKIGGHGKDDLIKVKSATKKGYEEAKEGDSINYSVPNSKTRRGRVGKGSKTDKHNWDIINEGFINQDTQASKVISDEGISNNICSGTHGYAQGYVKIGAIRGRNPENTKSRKSGEQTEQMLEINENETSNCLTSVQKDNVVVEEKLMLRDGRDNRSCLRAGRTPEVGVKGKSIRRLTPLECFRLQGFPDDFKKVVSDTQLYRQAGNSITVNVIQKIIKNIYK